MHLHIKSFITTKLHEILLSGFRGGQEKQDWWLKNIIPFELVSWGIISYVVDSESGLHHLNYTSVIDMA